MKSLLIATQKWVMVAALFLVVLAGPGRAYSAGVRASAKKQLVAVRLIGRAPLLPVTSFGANYQSYVAALQSQNSNELVKLVYRFLTYDASLPASFLDYDVVHKFNAIRQTECDEAADSLLYGDHSGGSGTTQGGEIGFMYARNASAATIPAASVLPCYVVTPADYKGSRRLPAGISRSIDADKDAAAPPASKSWRP